MNLLTRLRQLVLAGWSFWLKDGALAYRAVKDDSTADILVELKQHKAELVALLQQNPDCLDVMPLSMVQRAMWFEWQKDPQGYAYNVAFALRVDSEVQLDKLSAAFDALLNRHEALRCRFIVHEALPIAQRLSDVKGRFEQFSVAGLDDVALKQAVYHRHQQPFALECEPPIRLNLFTLDERQHILLLSFHHIIADGFSQTYMMVELLANYHGLCAGQAIDSIKADPDYGDFVRWQQQLLAGPQRERLLDYWREQLNGAPMLLDLPLDNPRGEVQSFNGRLCEFAIEQPLYGQLDELSGRLGVTRYTFLMALWQTLLYRYSGQADFVVGAPLLGRSEERFAEVVGNFVDPVVIRAKMDDSLSFEQLLQQVQKTVGEASAHQELPFALLVEALKPSRYPGAGLVFQTSFVLNKFWQFNRHIEQGGEQFGLKLSAYQVYGQQGMSDLDLVIEDRQDRLIGILKYNSDLFEAATIEAMAEHYRVLLQSALAQPDAPVATLPMLGNCELDLIKARLEPEFVATGEDLPLVRLIEQQARLKPDAEALDDGQRRLSFGELNRKANHLAGHLRAQGADSNVLVGVAMDRHVDMVVTLLAIHKAGAAWVALDPNNPLERLKDMVDDAALAFIVTDSQYNRFRLPDGVSVVRLDTLPESELSRYSGDNPDVDIDPRQIAYVIYTSGSTGKPKGVVIEQRNLSNFFYAMGDCFEQQSGLWLSATGLTFDIALLELLCPLAAGFCVAIAQEQRLQLQGDVLTHQQLPIDFSLYFFASDEGDRAPGKYELLLEAARFADDNDFEAVWTPERHFGTFGGRYPNPAVTGAAVAAVTRRVGVRSGSCVLPLNNPMKVVEDWSVVDNLSGGRVGMAFAPGWQEDDFIIEPGAYAERHRLLKDNLAQVRALWRGEPVQKRNPKGEMVEALTKPRPLQDELPVWLTIGGNPEAFESAGAAGFNVLTHLLGQSVEDLSEKIAAYRRAWREAGHRGEGRVTLMLHTFVSDSQEQSLAEVEAPFKQYLAESLALMRGVAAQSGVDLDSLDKAQFEQLLDAAFNRYKNTSALFGTPEHCLTLVDKVKGIGVDEVACLIDFGVDEKRVLESLQHLRQLQLLSQARMKPNTLGVDQWLERRPVTHFQCTPSLLGALLGNDKAVKGLADIKRLMVGGEALSLQLVADFQQAGKAKGKGQLPELYNMYGPSETTIWSSTWHYHSGSRHICLGEPLRNTRLYIIDSHLNRVAPGQIGELLISGDGVGRGYLNRAALSAERFIDNPFVEHAERAYLSGDLVRLDRDGNLRYVGRNDSQIKLRGLRIELGEIERRLETLPGVEVAVVLCLQDEGRRPYLCGFVLPEPGIEFDGVELKQLLRQLGESLPEYMVPSVLTQVSAFALNSNGKVDRKLLALSAATIIAEQVSSVDDRSAVQARSVALPGNAMENALYGLWLELLKLEPDQLGIDDNFFDLGGDSIVAIHLVSRAAKAGLNLRVNLLLKYPTIRQLAGQLSEVTVEQVPQVPVAGLMPLLPIQMAFFEHPEQFEHHNQSVLLNAPATLERSALVAMFAQLVKRHDALRMRFDWTEGDAASASAEFVAAEPSLIGRAVTTVHCQENFADLKDQANGLQRSLSLRGGELFKVALFDNGADVRQLLIIIHHLAVDGISWRIMLDDLATLWQQLSSGEPLQLADKTVSYQRWGEWLREYADSKALAEQAGYWTHAVKEGVVSLPRCAQDKPSAQSLGCIDIFWSEATTEAMLVDANKAYLTRSNELLLGALIAALAECGDDGSGFRIDLEGHGREPLFDGVDISQTVGWFTSVFPLRVECESLDWPTLVRAVKQSHRLLPDNGIGFGVAKYLGDNETFAALKQAPAAQLLFNYLGRFDDSGNEVFTFSDHDGGDAMSVPQQLIWDLNFNGLVKNGRLQFRLTYDSGRYDDDLMARLAESFKGALQRLCEHCCAQTKVLYSPSDFAVAKVSQHQLDLWQQQFDILDVYPMTRFQQGVLLLRTTTYVSQLVLELNRLNIPAMEKAWQHLVDSHDIFRSVFVGLDSGEPHQLVLRQATLGWQHHDISTLSPDQQSQHILEVRQRDRALGTDPLKAPLMRFQTWQLGNGRTKVLWTYHHCLTDGWSVPLLFEQFGRVYHAAVNDQPLPPVESVPYGDYVRWLEQTDHAPARAYWRDAMADVEGIAPPDGQNEADLESVIKELEVRFEVEHSNVLVAAAKHHKVTLSTLVQAAWALMMCSEAQTERAVFGTVLSGRAIDLVGVDKIVGPFINTVPVKIDASGNEALSLWLQRIQHQAADREAFGYLPLSDIKQATGLAANKEFFDAVIVDNSVQTNNFVEDIDWDGAGLQLTALENVQEINYPLSMNFVLPNQDRRLLLTWRYDQTCHTAVQIKRRADILNFVLTQFSAQQAINLSELQAQLSRYRSELDEAAKQAFKSKRRGRAGRSRSAVSLV